MVDSINAKIGYDKLNMIVKKNTVHGIKVLQVVTSLLKK